MWTYTRLYRKYLQKIHTTQRESEAYEKEKKNSPFNFCPLVPLTSFWLFTTNISFILNFPKHKSNKTTTHKPGFWGRLEIGSIYKEGSRGSNPAPASCGGAEANVRRNQKAEQKSPPPKSLMKR